MQKQSIDQPSLSTPKKFEIEWGGKQLSIEIGKYAAQANASCTVQYGDTVVLATVVLGSSPREGIDYFPLMVDYEERLYAAGKIKGSRFIKREGRPSDEAILTARLVDRSIRPLFEKSIRSDVQVVLTVLSWDSENDPDVPSLIGAACVLSISNIPWSGPIAGIRIGRIGGEFVINPSYKAREKSDLDILVAGSYNRVVMIEAGGKEVPEESMFEAIKFAQKHLKKPVRLIEEITRELGQEKIVTDIDLSEEEKESQEKVRAKVNAFLQSKDIGELFKFESKEELNQKIEQLKEELNLLLKEDNEVNKEERAWGLKLIDPVIEKAAEDVVLKQNRRVDGRTFDEIRPISAQVGVLPRVHGSGLFERGETQVLSVVTLGSPGDEQFLDNMEESGKKRFMHHYNFPGFCVGEVSPMRSPGRREIGHGALVEKAIIPMLPNKEEFPYTIRVVSEVLSSNGSSSQASVCASSIALMDAGVPIKKPIAGIAMGLILDQETGAYKVLTDIAGIEDHAGYMDFKISGTRDGITAIQLDIKTWGISNEIISETLEKAKKARLKILNVMEKVISEPRKELSPYAPRIETLHVKPDRVRDIIGPGGKMINNIIDKTGVAIDIEPDGVVMITSSNADGLQKAKEWIENLTKEVKVGEIYKGKVTRLLDFGAIVEILPGQDGMVHISELSESHVENIGDVLKPGDEILVKVINVDENGRIALSYKQALPGYDPKKDHRNNARSFFKKPFKGSMAHDKKSFRKGRRAR